MDRYRASNGVPALPGQPSSVQQPPPGGKNPNMGAPAFFVDQKKGEINELKQVCPVLEYFLSKPSVSGLACADLGDCAASLAWRIPGAVHVKVLSFFGMLQSMLGDFLPRSCRNKGSLFSIYNYTEQNDRHGAGVTFSHAPTRFVHPISSRWCKFQCYSLTFVNVCEEVMNLAATLRSV